MAVPVSNIFNLKGYTFKISLQYFPSSLRLRFSLNWNKSMIYWILTWKVAKGCMIPSYIKSVFFLLIILIYRSLLWFSVFLMTLDVSVHKHLIWKLSNLVIRFEDGHGQVVFLVVSRLFRKVILLQAGTKVSLWVDLKYEQ